MKPPLLIALGVVIGLVLAGAISARHQRLPGESEGTLYLPLPNVHGEVSEQDLLGMLSGVSVSPVQSRRLNKSDRIAFLAYMYQLCALAELPGCQDVYLSWNAQVWQILAVNFPETKGWLEDPNFAPNGMVSIKAVAKKIGTVRL
jgi:hypothetical protein